MSDMTKLDISTIEKDYQEITHRVTQLQPPKTYSDSVASYVDDLITVRGILLNQINCVDAKLAEIMEIKNVKHMTRKINKLKNLLALICQDYIPVDFYKALNNISEQDIDNYIQKISECDRS